MTQSDDAFDEREISQAADLLNEIPTETSLLLVPFQLRKAAEAAGIHLSDGVLRAIEAALSYGLVSDESKVFHTAITSETDGWPPPYTEADDRTRKLWALLESLLKHAELVARFSDLLLSSKTKSGVTAASRTAQAYLSAVEETLESPEAGPYLLRALTIARMYRLTAEENRTRLLAYQLSGRVFTGAVSLNLLRYTIAALVIAPISSPSGAPNHTQVERLVDTALQASEAAGPIFFFDSIVERAVLLPPPSGLAALRRRQVQAHLAEAAATTDEALRMFTLEETAQLARRFGINDLAAKAVRGMQALRKSTLGMKVHEYSIPVDPYELAVRLRPYREAATWQEALTAFFATPAPTGSHDAHVKAVEQRLKRPGVADIFGTASFGAHMMPERHLPASTQDSQPAIDQSEREFARYSGHFLAHGLIAIKRRFDPIPSDAIAVFIARHFNCDASYSEVLASALSHYWSSELTEAANLAIPLTEAGIRGLLLNLDVSLYRIEQGASPGRFPAMDTYLEELKDVGLDQDWLRTVELVYLSSGLNLRNQFAHGYRFGYTHGEAALTIRIAGLFVSLASTAASDNDGEVRAHFLANPTPKPRHSVRRTETRATRIRWKSSRRRRG